MQLSNAHSLTAGRDPADGLPAAETPRGITRQRYTLVDHISHFSGLAVAQFYLLCAAVTLYEVVAR